MVLLIRVYSSYVRVPQGRYGTDSSGAFRNRTFDEKICMIVDWVDSVDAFISMNYGIQYVVNILAFSLLL